MQRVQRFEMVVEKGRSRFRVVPTQNDKRITNNSFKIKRNFWKIPGYILFARDMTSRKHFFENRLLIMSKLCRRCTVWPHSERGIFILFLAGAYPPSSYRLGPNTNDLTRAVREFEGIEGGKLNVRKLQMIKRTHFSDWASYVLFVPVLTILEALS